MLWELQNFCSERDHLAISQSRRDKITPGSIIRRKERRGMRIWGHKTHSPSWTSSGGVHQIRESIPRARGRCWKSRRKATSHPPPHAAERREADKRCSSRLHAGGRGGGRGREGGGFPRVSGRGGGSLFMQPKPARCKAGELSTGHNALPPGKGGRRKAGLSPSL